MKVTIKQAAAYLNVSEITVRRRIKKGDLLAVKEETPQGFVWMIELAEVAEHDHPPDLVDHVVSTHATDQRLIAELENQIAWLKSELDDRKREHDRDRADWRDELQRLPTLMAQQGQTLQALGAGAAPNVGENAPQTRQDAPGDEIAGDVADAAPVPWWRRWWRSLTGEP